MRFCCVNIIAKDSKGIGDIQNIALIFFFDDDSGNMLANSWVK